jgi:hypothetical protein
MIQPAPSEREAASGVELRLPFFVNHMLAHYGVVLAQLHALLGIIAVLLQKVAVRAFAALHFDVIAGVFAFLGHVFS